MLRIFKSLGASAEPAQDAELGQRFTRFETAKDLAKLTDDRQFTRFQNVRRRDAQPMHVRKPTPIAKVVDRDDRAMQEVAQMLRSTGAATPDEEVTQSQSGDLVTPQTSSEIAEAVELAEPMAEAKSEPMAEARAEPMVETMPKAAPSPHQPANDPISPDILRRALPKRFAAMQVEQRNRDRFAT